MFALWIAAVLAQDIPVVPAVRVRPADLATGAVTIDTASETVDRTLSVALGGNARGTVTIDLGPLAGPTPTPGALSVEPTQLELAPGQSTTLHLTGTLPAPGAWVGQLNLTFEPINTSDGGVSRGPAQTTSAPFTINRLAPAGLQLEVEPPASVRFSPIAALWADPAPLRVVADVTNPGPAEAKAQGPFLTGLVDAEGVGAPGFSVTDGAAGVHTFATGMTQLPATATWTPTAGTWTGQVKLVDQNGGVSVVRPYTLHAKHGPLLCALALVAGTLANYVVHRWTTTGRRRNVALTNLARLARRIEALTGDALRFRAAFLDALDDVRARIEEDAGWDPGEELKALGVEIAAVTRLEQLYRECEALIGLVDDPGRRAPLSDELGLLRRRLESGRREELRPVEGGVVLEVELGRLRTSAHTAAMESLVGMAERAAGALPTPEEAERVATGLPDRGRATWQSEVQSLRDTLTALRATPLSGTPPVEALVERRNRLVELTNRLGQVVAAGHLSQLVAGEHGPAWLGGQDRWPTLRAALASALAAGRIEEAARLWSDTVVGRAEVIAESWSKDAANQAGAIELRAGIAAIRGAPTAAAGLADCARVADRLAAAFQEMGAAEPTPPIVAVPGGVAVRWAPAPLPEEARLLVERKYKDTLVLLVAAAASVVVGLGTLWWPIKDFGSFTHYAAALLWGFSVQEAGRLTLPSLLKERVAQQ